jgi:hypothetical protein
MVSKFSIHEIEWTGVMITRKIDAVSLVGSTNNWHNHHTGRKSNMAIPATNAAIQLAQFVKTYSVRVVNQRKKIQIRQNGSVRVDALRLSCQ